MTRSTWLSRLAGSAALLLLALMLMFGASPALAQVSQPQEEQVPTECQRNGGVNTCLRLTRGSSDILVNNAYGCYWLDNGSGQDLFVPLGSAADFNAFISAASRLGVTADRCCPSTTYTYGPASDNQTFEITLPLGRDRTNGDTFALSHTFNLTRQDCTTNFDQSVSCNTTAWTETFTGNAVCDLGTWGASATTSDVPPAENAPPYVGPSSCGVHNHGDIYWEDTGTGSRAATVPAECQYGAGDRMLSWTVQSEKSCQNGVATNTGNTRNVNETFSGTCAAEPTDAVCGSASGRNFATTPASGFCSAGSFSGLSGSGPWNWLCYGFDGGQSVACAAGKTNFAWSAWSGCSLSCGSGTQTRSCMGSDGSSGNDPSLCGGGASSQACNTQACVTYAWTGFGSCSASCGGGTQTRSCRGSDGANYPAANCGGGASSQACNTQACTTYAWTGWSGCSAACGGGTQTRSCLGSDGNSYPAGNCGGASSQSCNTQACAPPCSATVVQAQTQTVNVAQNSGCPTGLWCEWGTLACGNAQDSATKFCVTGTRNGSVSLGFDLSQAIPNNAGAVTIAFGVRGGGPTPDLSNKVAVSNPGQNASTYVQQGTNKNYNYTFSYNGGAKNATLVGGATGWGSCDGDPSCGGKGGWAYPSVQVTYTVPPYNSNNACPQPVTGVCGPSNGNTFTEAPNSGLCITGTPSAVSGSGPWSWTCNGTDGGFTVNCSAQLQPADYLDGVFSGGGGGTLNEWKFGGGGGRDVNKFFEQ